MVDCKSGSAFPKSGGGRLGCLGDKEKPEIFWNFLLYYYRRGCEED